MANYYVTCLPSSHSTINRYENPTYTSIINTTLLLVSRSINEFFAKVIEKYHIKVKYQCDNSMIRKHKLLRYRKLISSHRPLYSPKTKIHLGLGLTAQFERTANLSDIAGCGWKNALSRPYICICIAHTPAWLSWLCFISSSSEATVCQRYATCAISLLLVTVRPPLFGQWRSTSTFLYAIHSLNSEQASCATRDEPHTRYLCTTNHINSSTYTYPAK